MLKTFNGTIQSDGYALYGAMERDRPGLKRLACWAHARRKFHDASSDDRLDCATLRDRESSKRRQVNGGGTTRIAASRSARDPASYPHAINRLRIWAN
ncbi:MAG: hypothetical protein EXS25_02500 [Pedosphaera sp.]|nr:hypothetical protein [Pedosphaera sp.]